MKIKFFLLLILSITTILVAQADSLNQQNRSTRKPGILESIFGSSEPDSLRAFYSKRSAKKIFQPRPKTEDDSKSSKFGFGYEYNMLLNTKTQEQGISIHNVFTDFGFEVFINYNKADEQDVSKLFPAENVPLFSHNLQLSGGTLVSDPVIDYESRFGLKIIKVLHQSSQSIFFTSVGCGIKSTVSMIHSRKYSLSSTDSGYYIRYLEENYDKHFSKKTFVSVSLGADYMFAESFKLKGEFILYAGDQGQFGPNVALYYLF